MSMISHLIDGLEELKNCLADNNFIDGRRNIINDAIFTIQDLSQKPTAANMERSSAYYNGGWIPTEERLPELSKGDYVQKIVIACTKSGYVSPMIYERTVARKKEVTRWKYYWDRIVGEEVIAWMPLPEPYKKEV